MLAPNTSLARVALMAGEPEDAMADFDKTLKLSQDPRTLAWTHIYRGRLYDIMQADTNHPQAENRAHAVAEYQAALAVRDGRPDTRQAAEAGIKQPFAPPHRTQPAPTAPKTDNAPFDPTGKAEKETYKPTTPPKSPK